MLPSDTTSLAIIFVLYNAYDTMRDFLDAQASGTQDGLHLIIVDNTPHSQINHTALDNFKRYPGVTALIAEPENLGYAGAANFAMQKLPIIADCDYVAISNTDLLYNATEMQKVLHSKRSEHDGVGAIAPRLVNPDGSERPQLHYLSAPSQKKYRQLSRIFSYYPLTVAHRLGSDVKRFLGFSRSTTCLPREIFAPHGALMILTREYFQKTRGFLHPAFLFCEEITIGAECRDSGLKVIYEPSLCYAHDNHGAMGVIPSRRIVSYLHDAHKAVLPRLP